MFIKDNHSNNTPKHFEIIALRKKIGLTKCFLQRTNLKKTHQYESIRRFVVQWTASLLQAKLETEMDHTLAPGDPVENAPRWLKKWTYQIIRDRPGLGLALGSRIGW